MLAITPADVSLSVSKLYFAYGFGNSLVYPLCSDSAAVLVAERPTPARVRELAQRHRVTILHAVPSAYSNLLADGGRGDFGSLRIAVSAGEPLPPALGARARALLGCRVLDELGSTEVGGAFCSNTLHDDVPGTVGRPLAGYAVELRDADSRVVPDGEPGQVWVRGPTLMTRYVGRPRETAATLRGGRLRTATAASGAPTAASSSRAGSTISSWSGGSRSRRSRWNASSSNTAASPRSPSRRCRTPTGRRSCAGSWCRRRTPGAPTGWSAN